MKNLYFIAILPPEKISQDARNFQQQAADLFHSRRALRNPPHITLIPPFHLPQKGPFAKPQTLKKRLKAFAERPDIRALFSNLQIELEDFGFFPPRVIFIRVKNNPNLNKIQAELQKSTADLTGFTPEKKRPFRPHLTIAYRDLRREVFPPAKRHFEKLHYRATFPAQNLTLLIHKDGQWVADNTREQ